MTGNKIKVKGKVKDGKFVPSVPYASVSDKLKRGERKKIVRGKRIK